MTWRIEYAETAKKDLARLGKPAARRILAFLANRVVGRDDPRSFGAALKGSRLGTYWRYRVGDYRIICELRDEHLVVLVVTIGHRSDVYR